MTKAEFKERYFIQEDGDSLSPVDAYNIHSKRIIENIQSEQNTVDAIENLNKEVTKCLRLLENAIYEILD